MQNEHHLSYVDQMMLFKRRGIQGIEPGTDEFKKQVNTLKIIGYYKLKQYAHAFWNKREQKYNEIKFNDLVKRYYRDQRLKHEIFQAIGDIETALNNQISYILGREDPYLYLDFEKWCQNRGRNKFLGEVRRHGRNMGVKVNKYKIKSEELSFLSQLQHQVKKSNYLEIQEFEKENNDLVFPSVWLMVNTLSFGQSIYMVKLMLPQSRNVISKEFFHTNVNKLVKNLELLNLIRNICCHNGDLTDISLKTMPPVPSKYRQYLNMDGNNYPHRLAIVVTVLLDLMYPLNKKDNFSNLKSILNSLCKIQGKDREKELAQKMGFKNKKAIDEMISSFRNKKTITFYPDGSYVYR